MQFHRHLIHTSKKSVSVAHKRFRFLVFTIVALIGMLFATAALAAGGSKLSDANATYQRDRSACLSGKSNEDRATCLREAGAALQAARSGQLSDGAGQLQANRLMRCNQLPEQDRSDCVRRMQPGGVVEGNSQSGGDLRESVTTEVGAPVIVVPDTGK